MFLSVWWTWPNPSSVICHCFRDCYKLFFFINMSAPFPVNTHTQQGSLQETRGDWHGSLVEYFCFIKYAPGFTGLTCMRYGLLCVKSPSLPSSPLLCLAFWCLNQAAISINLSDTVGTGSPRLTCSGPASPPSPAWNQTAWVTRSWWSSWHASRCMLMRSSKGQCTSVNCCILLFRSQFP